MIDDTLKVSEEIKKHSSLFLDRKQRLQLLIGPTHGKGKRKKKGGKKKKKK